MNSKSKVLFFGNLNQNRKKINNFQLFLSGIFWLLPMMKPEMHRGGLALIFLCCVGFWEGGGKGGGLLFNILFFLLFLFFSSKKTLFFHHILH